MALIEDFYLRDIKHRSDMFRTEGGDLELEDGLDNIKTQLMRRLVTVPGTIIHRPNYGVGILQYQNVTLTFDKKEKIALAIKQQFEADERVTQVRSISYQEDPNVTGKFTILVNVELSGYGEQAIQFAPFEG